MNGQVKVFPSLIFGNILVFANDVNKTLFWLGTASGKKSSPIRLCTRHPSSATCWDLMSLGFPQGGRYPVGHLENVVFHQEFFKFMELIDDSFLVLKQTSVPACKREDRGAKMWCYFLELAQTCEIPGWKPALLTLSVQCAFRFAFRRRIWNIMDFAIWALPICDITFGLKLKNWNKYLHIVSLINGNCSFKRLF